VLSLYFVKDYHAALDTCFALLKFGGMGHTAVIHSKNDQRTREYAMRMPAMRVLVNTPAPHGSIGITTNVFPAMTLGCGAVAGNITSDNIGPQNLINIKRLAYIARQPQEAFEMPIDYNVAPGATAGSPAAGTIERSAVAAAVERYLASRGMGPGGHPAAAAAPQPVSFVVSNTVDRYLASRRVPVAAPPAVSSSVVPNVTAQVVDRFLARRGVAASKTEFG
jgi:hypothetical protein